MNNYTNRAFRTPTRRRRRTKTPLGMIIFLMVILSLLLVGAIYATGYMIGYRYITVKTDNGMIKYLQ